MHEGQGEIVEVYLDPLKAAQIDCDSNLIPAPGQYLLAYVDGSDSPLAETVFISGNSPGGFFAAPPLPDSWHPGSVIHLRGPFGCGFTLPALARRVALVAFRNSPARLLSLLEAALKQNASTAMVCDDPPDSLPFTVEVQPLAALSEIWHLADYIAIDVNRGSLTELQTILKIQTKGNLPIQTQVLVRAPMPCGGLAKCGVCTVAGQHEGRLACEAGPVFDLDDLL